MDLIFPQTPLIFPAHPLPMTMTPVSAISAAWHEDRIARLGMLAPQDISAGLLWLAMNFPAVFDTMLDKIEYDPIDDPDPSREPEPFCAECGADIGIFLRFGLDWWHYRGGAIIGQIELFDPGHNPIVAWRLTGVPALR